VLRPMICDGGAGCADCGGAEVGAGYGRESLPRASWIEGRDCLGVCLSFSSSMPRRASDGEMYPGCGGAPLAGA